MISKSIELDITSSEINNGIEASVDDAIKTGRELRAAGTTYPERTVGTMYMEIADAADAGVDRARLRQQLFAIWDVIAKALISGVFNAPESE